MIERGERLLLALGAIEPEAHRLTAKGADLAELPLHPRVATMLLAAKARGVLEDGALVCALAGERDVLRKRTADRVGSSDLLERAEIVRDIERARFSPALLERTGADAGAVRSVLMVRDRLREIGRRNPGPKGARSVRQGHGPQGPAKAGADHEEALLRAILSGFPDRVAKRQQGDRAVLAGGGGARIAKESVVKDAELFVAVDVEVGPAGGLIRMASRIERSWLEDQTPHVRRISRARWSASREAVECALEVRYLGLVIEERPSNDAGEEEIARVLEEAASQDLDRALPRTDAFQTLEHRLAFVRRIDPELAGDQGDQGDQGDLRRRVLADLVRGKRSFAELRAIDLAAAARAALPHPLLRALDELAPERIEVPSGRKVELRYESDGPPVLSVRLQEVFGMTETPRIGRRVPIRMELLAPNQRPVQVTQDLASFWSTTYHEVRRELARRYPKHQWPEDPRDGDPRKRPGGRRR
jgi:ATP-dependent helicase HrpB